MVDARRLLDVLVGAAAKRPSGQAGGAPGQQGGPASPLSHILEQLFPAGGSGAAEPYLQRAKDFVNKNPSLAEAALASLAGILLGSRRRSGLPIGVARLGGLAVIGALAYKAYQTYQAGKAPSEALSSPSGFDPAAASEDDALLFARAMVAAATADGRVDRNERDRITAAMAQAGIDPQATRWLEDELASPATVEDLSEPVRNPEKAAQVYTAARLAVDPDTLQEREFLRQLAESLDLDPDLARRIDEMAAGVRT